MRPAVCAVALFACACASAPRPTPTEPPAEVPKAKIVWSVPVTMEDGVPTVSAQVRDAQTKFALSTGTSTHTLTKAFAASVRAPITPTRKTTKVHGTATEVETVDGVVSVNAAQAELRLQGVVALDTDALEARGMGGLLAPHALSSNTETIVIDLKGGALTLVEGDNALFDAWFALQYGEFTKVPIERVDGSVHLGATIGPAKVANARIDTASPKTQVDAGAVLAEVEEGACIQGAALMAPCLAGVPHAAEVAIGDVALGSTEVVAVPAGAAVVGADVLSQCVVAIGVGNHAHVACN